MITGKAIVLRFIIMVTVVCSQLLVCMAQTTANVNTNDNAAHSTGRSATALDKIKGLEGEWEAPLKGSQQGKVMVNTFRVIGDGSVVVHAEYLDGKQLTTTIFYAVGSELRADHFCDYGNQPRYTVKPTSDDGVLAFELRDVTNLDAHPRHFHSTTWHLIDAMHLTQDWQIAEKGKESKTVRMEFTRKQ